MHIVKTTLAAAFAVTALPLAAASDTRSDAVPAGNANTLYCMKVEAVLGSRIENIKCWTRAKWEEEGVDLERDWPREGVRVVNP